MSVLVEAPPPTPGPAPAPDDFAASLLRSRVSLRRKLVDRAALVGMTLSFVVTLVPLLLILGFLVTRGAKIISWTFLTADIPRQFRAEGGGMGPAVVGTLLITAAAAAMAVPLGVLGAIYLNEFGRQRRLARMIRFMSDVMAGVPSIVMGLFIFTVWVVHFQNRSGFAGALALACLMLPIVIRSTEEILRLVPDELRQGSLALGARRWSTIVTVVLPAAISGITSGVMLAVARAAGETAPLLFTIGLVNATNASLGGENTALSAQIFRNASQPFQGAQDRAFGAALTLVAIVFACTIVARLVARRFSTVSG